MGGLLSTITTTARPWLQTLVASPTPLIPPAADSTILAPPFEQPYVFIDDGCYDV